MSESPQLLTEIATRHQVYLEGLKTHEVKKAQGFLKGIEKIVTKKLSGKDLTKFSKNRLNKLLKSVRADLKVVSKDFVSKTVKESMDIAKYESGFEIRSLNQVVDYDFNVPTTAQLRVAVFDNPLTMNGSDNGKMLKPFLKDMSNNSIEQIASTIQSGYYQGETTGQIIRNIKGTPAAKYKDGALHRINRMIGVSTRTAVQHASVQAREQVWNDNEDIVKGVKWVSALDSRTSAICRTLDGTVYPTGKGLRPPAHPNCRSTVVAELDSRFDSLDEGATRFSRGENAKGESVTKSVPATETYYAWLKRQPAKFQGSVLGKNRAKLLRGGGLSSERFSELQLDKNFTERTLKEMYELEPLAFEKANIKDFI